MNWIYFVLEESKPQAAVKVQEAAKKPEVIDKTKKLEKKITPQEEEKPGIHLKKIILTPCVFRKTVCFSDTLQYFNSLFFYTWSDQACHEGWRTNQEGCGRRKTNCGKDNSWDR